MIWRLRKQGRRYSKLFFRFMSTYADHYRSIDASFFLDPNRRDSRLFRTPRLFSPLTYVGTASLFLKWFPAFECLRTCPCMHTFPPLYGFSSLYYVVFMSLRHLCGIHSFIHSYLVGETVSSEMSVTLLDHFWIGDRPID